MVIGHAVYMSPEQARGQQVDARTDICSLGVVLYEMVAGCRPFDGATTSDVMAAILGDEMPHPLGTLLARACRPNSSGSYRRRCGAIAIAGIRRSEISCSICRRLKQQHGDGATIAGMLTVPQGRSAESRPLIAAMSWRSPCRPWIG